MGLKQLAIYKENFNFNKKTMGLMAQLAEISSSTDDCSYKYDPYSTSFNEFHLNEVQILSKMYSFEVSIGL